MLLLSDEVILNLLNSECRWWTGLELVEKSLGQLNRGTIYVYLNRLEDAELVESQLQPTDINMPQQRQYRVTESGRRALLDSTQLGLVLGSQH